MKTKDKFKHKYTYNIDEMFKETFLKWQDYFMRRIFFLIFFFTIVELAFLFLYKIYGVYLDNHLYRFVIKPTALNIIVYFIGKFVYHYGSKDSPEIKIAVPILIMLSYCTNIVLTHYVFTALCIIYIVPVLLTVIYGDYIVEKKAFILAFLSFFLTFHINVDLFPDGDQMFLANSFIGLTSLITSHFVATIIIKYEKEKRESLIESMYKNTELTHKLLHDGLTKLYNHTGLFQYIENEIENYQDNDLQMVMIDIDNFKKVNDTYGHEFGNTVLKKLANTLNKISCDEVMVARYGGEEFSIVFRNKKDSEAYKIIDNLRQNFNNIVFKENNKNFSFSAGIAKYKKGMTSKELFEKADANLYEAKETGKNKVVIK